MTICRRADGSAEVMVRFTPSGVGVAIVVANATALGQLRMCSVILPVKVASGSGCGRGLPSEFSREHALAMIMIAASWRFLMIHVRCDVHASRKPDCVDG